MKIVMTIGGSDCSGGAGIQADIKTFSAFGVHGTSVLTAITAQNSDGVQAIQEVPVKIVEQQLESIMCDMAVDYAKTGMLYSAEIIAVAATQLKRYGVPFVLDPVMNAGAGGILLEDNALNTLIKLLIPICAVVTPNVPEASIISGLEIRDIEDAKLAALKINDMGASAVIIKGGHLEHEIAAGKATDLIYDGKFEHMSSSMIKQEKIVHGAGCTFSAALAAELAKGTTLHDAATSAKKFVYDAILCGVELPNLIVVNQSLRKDADRYFVLENVKEAVTMLKETLNFKKHIPEVGTNIGMAIADAESEHDVAAVDGRIIAAREGVHAGCVDFGVSSHVARLILTMMKHDKRKRSAINLKYTSELIEACEELGLTVSSFDRAKEPAGAKTMDWGVREASVVFSPDVVYDLGAVGKEPMVRIFGNTAVEVASKVKRIMAGL
ncbi:MAG: bifunctional hydroxymethylpyrimidine kinase/phosphomethylpyrimidine kinase [Methanophagales archaeon]|nr:bifunctional hydroxymethylpyrimidine kinase/phosphomethylpyrimidine kinase [Methanophagales archaeon]